MNKSAIEKMVEYLEQKVNPNNNEILSNADHLVVETYHEAFKKAISILAEEQAQNPTAPAGLVEDIETWGNKAVLEGNASNIDWASFDEILSRYRPAPSSADEGSLKILEPSSVEQAIELYRNNPIFNRLVSLRVQEILSRHPTSTDKSADRCKELVKRLREQITPDTVSSAVLESVNPIFDELEKEGK